jgi:peptidoglycan/LPS O-acetylase OafA/YrhL
VRRLPGLDLLRAIAIVWVLFTHAWVAGGLNEHFAWLGTYGWMGVDLFFVLSGYLIGGQLLGGLRRDGRVDFVAFYRRRACRILPAYLAVLGFYFLVPGFAEVPLIQPAWQFLTFTVNLFVDGSQRHAFSHVWSLCVEEHFYLMFPVVAWLGARHATPRRVGIVLVAVLVGGMAVRGWAWSLTAAPSAVDVGAWQMDISRYMEQVYYPTYARLDGLLLGVTLALLKVFRPGLWARLLRRADLFAVAGMATMALSMWIFTDILDAAACVVGFPLLAAGLAMVVLAGASDAGVLARVRIPGAGWLAMVSYSMYLTHKPIYALVARTMPAGSGALATFLACSVAVLAMAALLHYAIERPFLALRDRRMPPAAREPLQSLKL